MNDTNLTNEWFIGRQNDFESSARSYPRKFPFALKKAGTLALGHNDDEVSRAMMDLIASGAPLHTLDLTTPVKDRFVETIFSILPEEMQGNVKIQFCSPSGTDAVDAAIKLCKTATGRGTVIAFNGAYHGMGHGAMALTGNLGAKTPVQNLMPGVQFLPFPNSYRCPFGLGGEAGTDAACAYFERVLKDPESGITKPAAVIIEPIQGEGGVVPAPAKFLQTIRRVTRELGIPMIVDEIQCGIGRSGDIFAFQESGIIPDIILMSKAIGGSQPMSVVVYDRSLDKWNPGAHAGTFRGNQLAMAAGTVVLRRVSDPAFLSEVRRKGGIIRRALENLKAEVSIIGDVRGRGLMQGIEFIDPEGPKDIMGHPEPSGKIAAEVQKRCFENHLVMEKGGRSGSVMRCLCALTVTDDEISTMLDIFSSAAMEIDREITGR